MLFFFNCLLAFNLLALFDFLTVRLLLSFDAHAQFEVIEVVVRHVLFVEYAVDFFLLHASAQTLRDQPEFLHLKHHYHFSFVLPIWVLVFNHL